MYKLEIELTDEQFRALEDHRKQQKIRVEDPSDPEGVVERPQHKTVPAMIQAAIIQQFAPILHRTPSAEIQTLIREIQEKDQMVKRLMDDAVKVKATRIEDNASPQPPQGR